MNVKRTYIEENGKKYIKCEDYHNTRIFEIVEKFPNGYILWLVPKDYPDNGYIALAKPSDIPYNIIQEDLKCMFVGEEMWNKLHSYCHKGNEITSLNFNAIANELKYF